MTRYEMVMIAMTSAKIVIELAKLIINKSHKK